MTRVEKPDDTVLAGLVAKFKRDICELDLSVAVQKHLTYGPCCLLSSDVYFELKREIAEQFELHPAEVLVVGSAKLGFSIVPKKRYRFFNDESDIDVALVAPQLFEQVWAEVYAYWYGGAYCDIGYAGAVHRCCLCIRQIARKFLCQIIPKVTQNKISPTSFRDRTPEREKSIDFVLV